MPKRFDQAPREFDPETEKALSAFRAKMEGHVQPPSLEGDPAFDFAAKRKHVENVESAKQRFKILFGGKTQVAPQELGVLVEKKEVTVKDLKDFKDAGLVSEQDVEWLVANDFVYYDKNNELAVVEVLDDEYLKAHATKIPTLPPLPTPPTQERYFTDEGEPIPRVKKGSLNLHDSNPTPPKHLHVQKPK